MADQQYVIELEGDQRAVIDGDDAARLRDALNKEPGAVRLRFRPDDLDTEGHASASARLRVIVETDDDTEGHAMSLNFPSAAEADAFRKRMLVTGVLAGTVALGALGGIGLATMTSGEAATGAATGAAAGSAWTQDERPIAPAAAGAAAGSAWTQDERRSDEAVVPGYNGEGGIRPE